jgi:RNA polymerase sigma-70 factor (ECF subfamily)
MRRGAAAAYVRGMTCALTCCERGCRRLDGELIGQHLGRLRRAASALAGSHHDAEDLVQEAVARVLARPRCLRRGGELGYLLRTLENTHRLQLRRQSRRPRETPIEHAPPLADASVPDVSELLERRAVIAAVEQLEEPFRATLVAVDVAGLSYRNAATALGVREGTIMSRLHRARRRVIDHLEQRDAA